MRLKTFDAPTMQDAMQRVRTALGEQAIILSATKAASGGVRVTAAVEGNLAPEPRLVEELPPRKAMRHVSLEELRKLEGLWHFHGLPETLLARLRQAAHFIQYEEGAAMLPELLGRIFTFEARGMLDDDTVMLVGPPGTGKTLTAAKIAASAVMSGRPVQVVTCDAKRAGGVEQLKAFTDILGLDLHIVENPAQLQETLARLPEDQLTIIDTAGTNIFDEDDKRHLGETIAIVGVGPVLVLGAGCDAGEAQDIARTFAGFGASHLMLTRTDTARRMGGALAAAIAGDMALSHYTNTSRVAAGLETLDTKALAFLLSGETTQGDES